MTVISHPEFTARTALADATQCCHHDARTMPAGGSMRCILRLLSLPLMLLVHASALAATVPEIPMLRRRSEEHTSELQSLMRISYAVFCLNKRTNPRQNTLTAY